MSKNFVERFCHRYFQRNPKKSKQEILNNLTHLYLNGRKIEEIGEVTCEQLKVLYLHSNCIRKITNLDQLINLTHLYLQWNRIERMENLNHLKNLRKLYLSYNEISRLEAIDNLTNLEELHLEYQHMPEKIEFTFEVESLIGISTSLHLLNISALGLKDLNSLKILPDLVEIIAADNDFEDSEYIASSISHLPHLISATFVGCPAQKMDIYYRNKIILESKSLGLLDNKEINEVTRSFLERFDRVRCDQRMRTSNVSNDNNLVNTVDIDLRDEIQLVGSDAITFDVSNIISQAMVENIQ